MQEGQHADGSMIMVSAHAAEHAEESRVLIRVHIVKSSTSVDVAAVSSRALQDPGGPLPVSGWVVHPAQVTFEMADCRQAKGLMFCCPVLLLAMKSAMHLLQISSYLYRHKKAKIFLLYAGASQAPQLQEQLAQDPGPAQSSQDIVSVAPDVQVGSRTRMALSDDSGREAAASVTWHMQLLRKAAIAFSRSTQPLA